MEKSNPSEDPKEIAKNLAELERKVSKVVMTSMIAGEQSIEKCQSLEKDVEALKKSQAELSLIAERNKEISMKAIQKLEDLESRVESGLGRMKQFEDICQKRITKEITEIKQELERNINESAKLKGDIMQRLEGLESRVDSSLDKMNKELEEIRSTLKKENVSSNEDIPRMEKNLEENCFSGQEELKLEIEAEKKTSKRLEELEKRTESRFNCIEDKLRAVSEQVKSGFVQVDSRLSRMDSNFDSRLNRMDSNFVQLNFEFGKFLNEFRQHSEVLKELHGAYFSK